MLDGILAYPKVVSRDDRLAARKNLPAGEKDGDRRRDTMNAGRRRLAMVRIDRRYVLEGRRQLIVRHLMFGPSWKERCPTASRCETAKAAA